MNKTPKADALRAMRERNIDKQLERNRRDLAAAQRFERAQQALAKAEAKPRKTKRRKQR